MLVCSRNKETWIFFSSVFQFQNCLILNLMFYSLPTELLGLIWGKTLGSSTVLGREMLSRGEHRGYLYTSQMWTICIHLHFQCPGQSISQHITGHSECYETSFLVQGFGLVLSKPASSLYSRTRLQVFPITSRESFLFVWFLAYFKIKIKK